MSLSILALDVSTNCGWAHSNGESGVWRFNLRPDESRGMRLIRFRGKLNELFKAVGFDVIVFENAIIYGPKHAKGMMVQVEMQGVLKLWAEETSVEYKGYSNAEIKREATGKGNAKKELMLAAAQKEWPDKNIEDDNEADALWLLRLATKTLEGQ